MPNLRQEVTSGAQAFAEDKSITCPHLSADFETRGKQIRAVVLDAVIGLATDQPIPSIDLSQRTTVSGALTFFTAQASAHLQKQCWDALSTAGEGQELSRLYASTLETYDPEDEQDITSWPQEDTSWHLAQFIVSGVAFPTDQIYLATLAKAQDEPGTLYSKLSRSYKGMGKKFTSGKSVAQLDQAFNAIQPAVATLKEHITETKDGLLRTSPDFISRAQQALPASIRERLAQDDPIEFEDPLDNDATEDEGSPGLCPASIEVHRDGRAVVAEKVWRWTVLTAQSSRLIERIRELEATV